MKKLEFKDIEERALNHAVAEQFEQEELEVGKRGNLCQVFYDASSDEFLYADTQQLISLLVCYDKFITTTFTTLPKFLKANIDVLKEAAEYNINGLDSLNTASCSGKDELTVKQKNDRDALAKAIGWDIAYSS